MRWGQIMRKNSREMSRREHSRLLLKTRLTDQGRFGFAGCVRSEAQAASGHENSVPPLSQSSLQLVCSRPQPDVILETRVCDVNHRSRNPQDLQ